MREAYTITEGLGAPGRTEVSGGTGPSLYCSGRPADGAFGNIDLLYVCQARDPQSKQSVFPVPVGDSRRAFVPVNKANVTFSI